MRISSQMLALWLLWRPGQDPGEADIAAKIAALLPAIAWAPFFLALAAPGTAVEDERAISLVSPASPSTSCRPR